jgi:hypothetical protein
LHRDLALWSKPWAEIGPQIAGHYLYALVDLEVANDAHRTPGNPCFSGSKVFIRTIEGLTCVSSAAGDGDGTHAAGH